MEKEIMYLAFFKKLNEKFFIRWDIFKAVFFVFWAHLVKKYFVIKRVENIDAAIPIINVTANPLIGPESKWRRIKAAKNRQQIVEKTFRESW